MSEKLVSQRQELRGVGVSSGIGFGHARVMQTSSLQVPRYSVTAEDVSKEVSRFKKAVGSVSRELDQMIRRSPKKAPKEVKTFLEVFKLLVNDSTMFEDVSDRVKTQLINVEWALQKHLEDTLKLFDSLTDAYLAERSDDIVHVVRRLQEELTGERRKICFAEELLGTNHGRGQFNHDAHRHGFIKVELIFSELRLGKFYVSFGFLHFLQTRNHRQHNAHVRTVSSSKKISSTLMNPCRWAS